MTALPPASNATNAAASEGDVKTYLTALREFLAGLLGTTGLPADARNALGVATLTWGNITGKPTTPNIAGNWQWAGQTGQPTYVWGSNDGSNFYVWSPSNFSVNYATYAGTASNNAPMTAVVNIAWLHRDSNGTDFCRATRANGGIFDFQVTQTGAGGGGEGGG
ncbi:hypothetical protein [Propionivibrio sp.]|uniref:hypothetical protein n=1 Tax=Propionivibrio sp. TaxID=2212460 RepID=UPI0039E56CB1